MMRSSHPARQIRVPPWTIFALALAVGLAAWPQPARAQDSTMRVAENLVVRSGETVADVLVFSGEITVEEGATVTGDVFGLMATTVIAGEVGGDVFNIGSLSLAPTARIDGNVSALGDYADEGATISGTVDRPERGFMGRTAVERPARTASDLISRVAVPTLLAMFLAVLAVAAAPLAMTRVREAAASRPGASWSVGCLAWILLVPLALALALTVVGAPVLLFVYLVGLMLGWVAVGEIVGRGLVPGDNRAAAAAVGLGLITAVSFLALLAGPPTSLAALALGTIASAWPLGASILSLFGTRSSRRLGPEDAVVPVDADSRPVEVPDVDDGSVTDEIRRWAAEADTQPPETSEWAPPPADVEAAPPHGPVDLGRVPSLPQPMATDLPPAPPFVAPPSAFTPPPPPAVEPAPPEPAPPEPMRPEPTPPEPTPPEPAPPHQHSHTVPGVEIGLLAVPGVTPIYAELLREAGITSVASLAAQTPSHVAEIVSAPGVLPVAEQTAAAWIDAARRLSGMP